MPPRPRAARKHLQTVETCPDAFWRFALGDASDLRSIDDFLHCFLEATGRKRIASWRFRLMAEALPDAADQCDRYAIRSAVGNVLEAPKSGD